MAQDYLKDFERIVSDYTQTNELKKKWNSMFSGIEEELNQAKIAVESRLAKRNYPMLCFDIATLYKVVLFVIGATFLQVRLTTKISSWLFITNVNTLKFLFTWEILIVALSIMYLFVISKKNRRFYKKDIEMNLKESLLVIENIEKLLNLLESEKGQSEIEGKDIEGLSDIKYKVDKVTKQAFKFIGMTYFYEIDITKNRDE